MVVVTTLGIPIVPLLQFDFGKYAIQPANRSTIEEIAKVMSEHPEIIRVAVRRHTDAKEPRPGKLATARANAVVDALVKLKVDRARLVVEAPGAEEPLDTNNTDQGRARNRRVDFKIREQTSCPSPGATSSVADPN
ncbi:OmpA family protein [Sorangium sp. So ce124]|uniref:OmpA family protein n=1 Tax=Sorangium sp. So ce124 TaxID=3133280 RepID=UPI003F6471B4